MRYKVKSIAALQLALGSLPGKMRVEVDQRSQDQQGNRSDAHRAKNVGKVQLRRSSRDRLDDEGSIVLRLIDAWRSATSAEFGSIQSRWSGSSPSQRT
jgi:hypothetical protein